MEQVSTETGCSTEDKIKDELFFCKSDIAFNMTNLAYLLDNMSDGQRLLDFLKDEEEILIARSIIHDQEMMVRQIMEDNRDIQARIKRFEKLSGVRSGNQQPRANP